MPSEIARVLHYVRAWSGTEEDESPVCGADKNAPDVWGHRTQYVRSVTCDKCRGILKLPALPKDEAATHA